MQLKSPKKQLVAKGIIKTVIYCSFILLPYQWELRFLIVIKNNNDRSSKNNGREEEQCVYTVLNLHHRTLVLPNHSLDTSVFSECQSMHVCGTSRGDPTIITQVANRYDSNHRTPLQSVGEF